eukprot:267842_1
MSQSTNGQWIWCQEVLNPNKQFWMHSTSKEITYTDPSETDINPTILSPKLHKQKSSTPPPNLYRNNTSYKPSPQKPQSKTDDNINHKSINRHKTYKKRLHKSLSHQPSMQRSQRINDNSMDFSSIDMYESKKAMISTVKMSVESVYDIKVGADIDAILQELLGYEIMNMRQSILDNDYIQSDEYSFLLYRYQSINSCISHIKEFKPPLNDKFKEIEYFRNIEYPQYPLKTNSNIAKIIKDTYINQKPYLRIRIPVNINVNILGNINFTKHHKSIAKLLGGSYANEQKSNIEDEIFNIELSSENLSNTTVQDFFHYVAKGTSGVKDDEEIKRLFLGIINNDNYSEDEHENDDEYYAHFLDDNVQQDWSKLAIKANGFEEYIFYSINPNDKICNY